MQTVFPTLRILDYEQAVAFYVRGLGFSVDWEWRHEPGFPVFMQLSRAAMAFYLSEHSGDCQPGGSVHLYVADVDAWYAEVAAAGVAVKQVPTSQVWGNRDMVVIDPFGNRLVIAQRLPKSDAGDRAMDPEAISASFVIREANSTDAAAVLALFRVLDDLHSAAVPYQFRGSSAAARSEQLITDLLANPATTILVADAGSTIVGHVVVEIRETPSLPLFVPRKYGQVNDLVVAEAVRRQGVGRALMRAAERWALDRGGDSVELGVWDFNESAARFYEQLGYATQFQRLRRTLP